ncbi:diacylglycerol/lipid kinase family protein [Deinococcus yavapaiensis]|uniref:YegS/Rv2252/BmrU family lipid kinase n=1 Tax=Deinococcus yavapaiensis KR-236 TaxID=694435 RepID=A0A318SC68_9DEIO|nr:diacylglycerol kinase family protein [Deinococcus yavapaiensis]PYE56608.1 YegS/Rv2252/BmrU family lipid kinase [Deinococcus yavapaiensis KR-236]
MSASLSQRSQSDQVDAVPLAVVLNPHAGRGLAMRTWPLLERALRTRRLAFDVILAHDPSAALARVHELPASQPLLAVGGDGTVSALLPALVGTGRPLGIVPLGSGNDFAGMLGLKSGDFEGALARLSSPPRPFDAVRVKTPLGSRVLVNGLGMGFDARITAKMSDAPAWLNGFGRYAWSALNGVKDLRAPDVEVVVDGDVTYAGPCTLVAVMNGTRYGGGFRISPDSDPSDGCLDVVLGKGVTRGQLLRLMGMVLRGAHLDDPRVRCWKGKDVRLRWQTPTHAHLDGDVIGEVTDLRACVEAGALQIY